MINNRIKGFAWGLVSVVAVAAIGYITQELPNLGLPEVVAMILIVLCEQITKFLNKKYQLGKLKKNSSIV